MSKPETQKQFWENLINGIKNPFYRKKEKKKREKENKEKIIKNRIIRDIRTPFEED